MDGLESLTDKTIQIWLHLVTHLPNESIFQAIDGEDLDGHLAA